MSGDEIDGSKLPAIVGHAHIIEGRGPASVKPARQRKPGLRTLIAQAEKSGKKVTSITTPDGVTMRFDEPSHEDFNPWDSVLHADQKRPS
jgi:hypothetical protein